MKQLEIVQASDTLGEIRKIWKRKTPRVEGAGGGDDVKKLVLVIAERIKQGSFSFEFGRGD